MSSLSWVVLDFETASGQSLRKVGAFRYAEDPTTEIVCLAFSLMGEPVEIWKPDGCSASSKHLLWLAEHPDVTFIAHTAAFEKAIWRSFMVAAYSFPDIPDHRWHDIMAVCAMKVIPQSLEEAAQVLGLDEQKDMEGSKLVRTLSKPKKDGSYDRSVETMAKVEAYCAQDVQSEIGLHRRIGWLPPGERRVWLLDQTINQRGIGLDLQFVEAAQKVAEDAARPLLEEFRGLTGGINPGQRDKVLDWLGKQGTFLPDMKKETVEELLGGEDDEDQVEAAGAGLLPHVHRALSIRSLLGSSSLKKLERMAYCACDDGRARGLLQYHGAGPGRWAGRLLQPQNFPRGTVKFDPGLVVDAILSRDFEFVEMLFGCSAIEVVVSALRHAIQAAPGHALCAGDFAGIEARIVLALSGQHDKVALMASGQDVYCDMASQIYGRPITKADDEERKIGKFSVLGLGFQMGAQKFHDRYAKGHPIEFAEDVVQIYRKQWAPNVPYLWYGLEEAAVRAVHEKTPHSAYGVTYELEDGWLTARLPSGRKLWYFNPRATRRAMPWDHTDVRPGFQYQANKVGRWTTVDAFGGLLTENVVQGLARDIMVAAMFKCEEENLPIILTVHDEIVTEPEEARADPEMLQQIMADIPDWAKAIKVPISAETWTGDRYRK